MKKAIVIVAGVMAITCAQAQATGLTFQWHGQTLGVDFGLTNLTAGVKGAIRDDVAYSLSLIPTTNVTFEALTPTSSNYGKYAGFVTFSHSTPINYCDGILCYYNTSGGQTVFQLDQDVCSAYAVAITLTNQHAAAVTAFSNFVSHAKTGFDVTGMTLAEKKAFFWGTAAIDALEREEGANFDQVLTDALSSRPSDIPPWAFPPMPSILAFSAWDGAGAGLPVPMLLCKVKRWDPVNKTTHWSFVYADGRWKYCLMEL